MALPRASERFVRPGAAPSSGPDAGLIKFIYKYQIITGINAELVSSLQVSSLPLWFDRVGVVLVEC